MERKTIMRNHIGENGGLRHAGEGMGRERRRQGGMTPST